MPATARLVGVLPVHVFAVLVEPPPLFWLCLLPLPISFQLFPSAFGRTLSSGPPLVYPLKVPSATGEADFPDPGGLVPTARTVSFPALPRWPFLLPLFLVPPQPLAQPSYRIEHSPYLPAGFGRL